MMIDATTKVRLHVSTDGTAGPYIMVPFIQLNEVCRLLKDRGIPHWAEEEIISWDGAPEIAVVNLERDADVGSVQALLDSAA